MIQVFYTLPLLLAIANSVTYASPVELKRRLDNGLGKTPALGWNSWNVGQCSAATATSALAAANSFLTLGLKDLGYTYINIDDCWSLKSRNSSGFIVPDPTKWPNGIKAVADEIHSMGLKFGLYGCSGTQTCAGFPGSLGYEARDAATLAEWGVDYWKYDNCNTPSGNSSGRFMTMRDALEGARRPILYSLCQWGRDSVWTWGKTVGNSWRMSGDIEVKWASVASIASQAADISSLAGPGGFNDLDMMEIGNGGLNPAEERTHFALWCLAKSPIILGTDLTKIPASSLQIIKNKALLSISQDPLGKAATTFIPDSTSPVPVSGKLYPYWTGHLSDGVVVALIAVDSAVNLSVKFADVPGLGGAGSYKWKELVNGTTGYGTSVKASLEAHDIAVFKVMTGENHNG
ncbi:hypothetical protein G7Y89_g11892 [Cudoniella acicularis]|uniref:Alpha-galactosidase n=1 Tax=Cudoniella acicularis TaxID=354080 RepID=A0A8H4RBI6_9HELO|nr:hypothetical protein G7Y89_g11892 [Cudoniella acicularis]